MLIAYLNSIDKVTTSVILPQGVSFIYKGRTSLTVNPPITKDDPTIKKGDKYYLPKSDKEHEFIANDSIIATAHFSNQVNEFKVKGGTQVADTAPFTFTIELSETC